MAIVLRFVDIDGFLRERFFAIVNVTDTTAATLKKEIFDALGRYDLHIHNMRGQGYDGARNMRGSWNGLQTLFLKECSCAYYVHCFAHRLQLALIAVAKKELLVNVILCNQIGNLLRPRKTRWSSNFDSLCSMVDMYGYMITVLENMVDEGSSNSIRGEASGLLIAMKSFDFIFILHLMKKITRLTNLLCRALQERSLDILNAMEHVSTTKTLLHALREQGFDILLNCVEEVSEKYDIEIPQMEARYKSIRSRSCQQKDLITVKHHYQFDVFVVAINFQIEELNSIFKDKTIELLKLSGVLEPKDNFKFLNVDHIYQLAEKFYHLDFDAQDLHHLRTQLAHYELDMPINETTTERSFSAMKLVKTTLRNKME
ncbi:zinc finger MYM-type protein 1-like [Impatiens glandulifera]|uniref:zinc finger MYM-type protein 1-like n=1 Tax=Impatiens glandulifera TaxID=253017 RepID=UPI001FB0D6D4|nr:zinc finger MYM-type protein 1-like [Impatiens glandulifera]